MTKIIFRILFTILSIFTVFILGAAAQTGDLASKPWKLTSLNGAAIEETKAMIEIDPATNRFNGNAGCNQMFGSVKVSEKNITFADVATTKMRCTDGGIMKLETDFTSALAQATRYKVSDDVLTVYKGNRRIMRFSLSKNAGENKPAEGTKLEDRKWVLEWIGDKPAGALGSQAFISFFPDRGSAGGNTSCNAYGGDYTVKGRFLTVRQVISTMRACIEDDRMQIERSFLYGLERADRYEIRGGKLYFYHGAALLLTFRGEEKNK